MVELAADLVSEYVTKVQAVFLILQIVRSYQGSALPSLSNFISQRPLKCGPFTEVKTTTSVTSSCRSERCWL